MSPLAIGLCVSRDRRQLCGRRVRVRCRTRRIPNFITLPALFSACLLHQAPRRMEAVAQRSCRRPHLRRRLPGLLSRRRHGRRRCQAHDGHRIGSPACPTVAYLLALTAIAGGLMAVGLALVRGRLQQTIMNVGELARTTGIKVSSLIPDLNLGNAQTLRLPYGLAIAAGKHSNALLSRRIRVPSD